MHNKEAKPRVLIVEDYEDLAKSISKYFELENFETFIAASCAEATSITRSRSFDLVLADIMLPDGDGTNLTLQLRENNPDLEFILMTGNATLESAMSAVGAEGIISYEVKPIDMDRIVYLANQIVRRRRTEKELLKHHDQLEDLVRLRTAELEKTNDRLRAEIEGRKQVQEKLEASEKQFRTLIDNLPIGLYRSSPGADGRFIMVNPKLLEKFGYESEDELIGRRVKNIYLDPQGRQVFSDALMREGTLDEFEILFQRKDGTAFWGAATTHAVRDENGEIKYFDGSIKDITEKKNAQEEVERYRRHLEDLVEERTRELQVSHDRLQALSQRIISTQEDERLRISSELHDELGQQLTALSLELEFLLGQDAPDKQHIESVAAMVENLSSELRRLCKGLRPMTLDVMGLEPAIESLVLEYEGYGSFQTKLSLHGIKQEVPPQLSIIVYRILQECLTNALRHSNARNVDILMFEDNGILVLEVTDDGVGFEASLVDGSRKFGLAGMRERAALCGGEIKIDSQRGYGAKVLFRAPLQD